MFTTVLMCNTLHYNTIRVSMPSVLIFSLVLNAYTERIRNGEQAEPVESQGKLVCADRPESSPKLFFLQHFPWLGSFTRGDDACCFQLIEDTGGAGIADHEAALQNHLQEDLLRSSFHWMSCRKRISKYPLNF